MTTPPNITQLLLDWNNGDKAALEQLLPIVYQELRRLAEHRLHQERANHTLQATALVNELYLRLINWQSIEWKNRAHFFGVAAQMMRNILVDHARARITDKRGGERYKISFSDIPQLAKEQNLDLIALDDALTELAQFDEQQSRIVELRYFAGLSIEETAEVLGISTATVSREWQVAKLWLLKELSRT